MRKKGEMGIAAQVGNRLWDFLDGFYYSIRAAAATLRLRMHIKYTLQTELSVGHETRMMQLVCAGTLQSA